MPWENLQAEIEGEFSGLAPVDVWALGQAQVASKKALFSREWRKFNRGKVLEDTRLKNKRRYEKSRVNKLCLNCRVWFSPLRISSDFCTLKCQKFFNNKNRCYVEGKRVVKKYTKDPTPGEFDHKGGDCPIHGDNIAVFRPKGEDGQFKCVACELDQNNE